MDSILDIFNNSAFSVQELTDAINIVPNKYGRINELGLFAPRGIFTTSATVEFKDGVLNLLSAGTRGAPAPANSGGKRRVKTFQVPHIPLEDRLTADELQNIRAFGTTNQLAEVMTEVNLKLADMRNKQAITLEWLRMGALKGVVIDGDGSTVLLNLFTDFGVTEKEVDFALDSDSTDVQAKCREVVRHLEDNLLGDTMTGVRCLCDATFFDNLVAHPAVHEAYQFQQGVNPMRDDMRKGFEFQGITFEEYRAQATASDLTTNVKFLATGEARFIPMGTSTTFRQYHAPGDFIETVNTRGQELYAKLAVDAKFQRWVDIHVQSNPLPLCLRPALLVKGTHT